MFDTERIQGAPSAPLSHHTDAYYLKYYTKHTYTEQENDARITAAKTVSTRERQTERERG